MAPSAAPASSSLRPTRAAHRYRKGQAPKGYADAEEDEDDDASEQDDDDEQGEDIVARRKREKAAAQTTAARRDGLQVINQGQGQNQRQGQQTRAIKVEVKTDPDALLAAAKVKQEETSSGEEESSEEEEDSRVPSTSTKPLYRAPGSTTLPPIKREEESSSGEEETSSEEEEEEEAPKAVLYKPVFVSKRVRDLTTPAASSGSPGARESSTGILDEEALEMKRQSELEERRRQSTLLAGEAVKRELAGKETEEKFPDVDDTDSPESDGTAFESWKLRELMRVKRERESDTARSKEREEIEARRALPEALRLKEDNEHAASLRAAKAANRGSQNFLQKYHHKGAFFADDEVLQRYDYNAPTEGEAGLRGNVESLPKVMQVRNYGKMGRTKYTHLVDQDTSDRNAGWSQTSRPGGLGGGGGKQGANHLLNGSGCFHCGGNHMKAECPELRNGGASAGPSGANASTLAPRQRRRSRSPDAGPSHPGNRDSYRPPPGSIRPRENEGRSYGRREERENEDRYRTDDRDRRDSRRRSRNRSGSRSPRRDRDREEDRYRGSGNGDRDDKRRRRD